MDFISYLTETYPALTYILGGLAIAITAYAGYVKLTPNKEDDKRWEEIKSSRIFGPLIRLITSNKPKDTPKK